MYAILPHPAVTTLHGNCSLDVLHTRAALVGPSSLDKQFKASIINNIDDGATCRIGW
jgi:hypothetical protein